MISPSLDHLPFMAGGADISLTIEQRIPLSPARRHRRESALADPARRRAEATTASLDVAAAAATAFRMALERQRMRELLVKQVGIARELVGAADARYAGTGVQSDVLRAEVEVTRLETRVYSPRNWASSLPPSTTMIMRSHGSLAQCANAPARLLIVASVSAWTASLRHTVHNVCSPRSRFPSRLITPRANAVVHSPPQVRIATLS